MTGCNSVADGLMKRAEALIARVGASHSGMERSHLRMSFLLSFLGLVTGVPVQMLAENGGAKVFHGSGVMIALRSA